MSSQDFPKLFKKNSEGGIEEWSIWVTDLDGKASISVAHGQMGGSIQTPAPDVITEGKNIGKKNETSPLQQAIAEAKSKWEKKLKKGYVKTLEAAQAGEVDSVIEGGVPLMKAHKWKEQSHKIVYPCAVQPKLDGMRCASVVKDDSTIGLWNFNRAKIDSVPHIISAVEDYFSAALENIFDGELYNHDLKKDFEGIISGARTSGGNEKSALLQFHIYDIVDTTKGFDERYKLLSDLMEGFDLVPGCPLKLVPSFIANSKEEVEYLSDGFIEEGYEGAIVRNLDAKYEGKRSYNVQKIKNLEDDEFEIVGVVEGRGKLKGLVGAFECKTANDIIFTCSAPGDQKATKKYVDDPSIVIGKKLTVEFMGYGKHGRPRIPKGKAIRDYE